MADTERAGSQDSTVGAIGGAIGALLPIATPWRANFVESGVSREIHDGLTMLARCLMGLSDAYRDWVLRETAA